MLKSRLLIVEDEPGTRLGVRTYLETYGYDVEEADTLAAAMTHLRAQVACLALVKTTRWPDGTALDLLRDIKLQGIDVPVIVLTGHGSIELAVMAVKEGAKQFLTKPVEMASLAHVVDRVIEHQAEQPPRPARCSRASRRAKADCSSGRSAPGPRAGATTRHGGGMRRADSESKVKPAPARACWPTGFTTRASGRRESFVDLKWQACRAT